MILEERVNGILLLSDPSLNSINKIANKIFQQDCMIFTITICTVIYQMLELTYSKIFCFPQTIWGSRQNNNRNNFTKNPQRPPANKWCFLS